MIGYLRGASQDTGTLVATMFCGGVGYEVNTNEPIRNQPDLALWIHEHAPQDAPHELYGFREREQRDLFRRLLNIKGVGPKVAMRIVASGHRPGSFDQLAMTKIRGVGATLAQRIAEELQ